MREPRPHGLSVPAEYGLAGPGDERSPWLSTRQRFAEERTWWVATTRADGRPHVMPVWGVIAGDGALIFSTDDRSVKGRNLAAQPAISIHLESGDDVAIIEGTAVAVPHPELPEDFVANYLAKYDIDLATPESYYAFFRVDPARIFAWNEARFADTAVRWDFD